MTDISKFVFLEEDEAYLFEEGFRRTRKKEKEDLPKSR